MNPPSNGSKTFLPIAWEMAGNELLEDLGLDEFKYKVTLRDRILRFMAQCCWKGLDQYCQKTGVGAEKIGEKKLHLHRANTNRWISGDSIGGLDKFCGVIVVGLREEMARIPLPRNQEIVWETVRQTLGVIRSEELKADVRWPDKNEFACVRSLVRHPRSDALTSVEFDKDQGRTMIDVLGGIAKEHQVSLTFGRNALREWTEPYLLFRVGLQELTGWEFLDEEAV